MVLAYHGNIYAYRNAQTMRIRQYLSLWQIDISIIGQWTIDNYSTAEKLKEPGRICQKKM